MRARTKDNMGKEQGTFTAGTRPTRAAVQQIIQMAADDVVGKYADIDAACQETAREAIKLKAAMEIELSYFPEQITTGRSPFEQYRELYNDTLTNLEACVSFHAVPGSISANSPRYFFPAKPPMIGLKTRM
jgi:hypothetical protein